MKEMLSEESDPMRSSHRIFRYSYFRTWLPLGLTLVVVSEPLWLPPLRGSTTAESLSRIGANGSFLPFFLLEFAIFAVGLWGTSRYGKVVVFDDRIERWAYGVRLERILFSEIVRIEKKQIRSFEPVDRYVLVSTGGKLAFLSSIEAAEDLLTLIENRVRPGVISSAKAQREVVS